VKNIPERHRGDRQTDRETVCGITVASPRYVKDRAVKTTRSHVAKKSYPTFH